MADADGNLTTSVYDGYERLWRTCFADSTGSCSASPTDYEQYSYDVDSNLTAKRNRDGKSLAMVYDTLNRLTERDTPANASGHYQRTLTQTYDLASRPWSQQA